MEIAKNCMKLRVRLSHEFANFSPKCITLKSILVNNPSLASVRIPLEISKSTIRTTILCVFSANCVPFKVHCYLWNRSRTNKNTGFALKIRSKRRPAPRE